MPIPRRYAPLIDHWHTALREPFGIVLRTNNPRGLVTALYAARAAAADLSLASLSICRSPRDGSEIWIVKREGTGTVPTESEP